MSDCHCGGLACINCHKRDLKMKQETKEQTATTESRATLAEIVTLHQQGKLIEILSNGWNSIEWTMDGVTYSLENLSKVYTYRVIQPSVTITRDDLEKAWWAVYTDENFHKNALLTSLAERLGL